MFCRNCGNAIGEGVKFCNKCGTRVLTESAAEEVTANVEAAMPSEPEIPEAASAKVETVVETMQPPMNETPEKPAKKKGGFKTKAIVACILAAVILTTSGLAALFVPSVGNFFAKTVMPADKYFAYVQKNNAETLAADLSSMISMLGTKKYTISAATADAEITIGEGMKELLRTEGGSEAAEVLGWIQTIGMHMDADITGNVYGTNSSVSINGKAFINAKMIWDMERGYIYLSLPGIQDQALQLYTGITLSQADYDKLASTVGRFVEIVPDEKTLEKMLTRYISAITDEVTNAEKKSETIKAGEVSQRVTRIDVPITEKMMVNVAKAVLAEVKKDGDIKDIIKKFDALAEELGVSFDADKVWDELVEDINETMEDLKEADPSAKKLGTLKCWVDASGDIVGLGFRADEVELKAYAVEKGDQYGVYMLADAGGRVYKLDGGGVVSGDKRSGEFNLSVGGSNIVKVTLSDVDDAKLKNAGLFSGKLTIEPADSISGLLGMAGGDAARYLRGAKFVLTSDMVSDYEGTAEMEVHLGGKHFVTMKVNAKVKDGSGLVQIPADYTGEYDAESWAAGMNQGELGAALEKVDAPEEVKRKLVAPPAPTETEVTFGTGVALP
ncbi:MAG: zinc ribbon domain-containing protein [Clostridia bacterium]|nr:zinc ribbon domain-containing protein [Clostridia bacterium]